MTKLVLHCFHWIGFHYVDHLLNQGELVIGYDPIRTEKEDFLSLFFGRNAAFQFIQDNQEVHKLKYNDEIEDMYIFLKKGQIINLMEYEQIPANHRFLIQEQEEGETILKRVGWTFLKLPVIFGPWMSKDDLSNNDYETGVYIDDFVSWLYSLSALVHLPETVLLQTSNEDSSMDEREDADKIMCLKRNTPPKKGKELLKQHIKRYPFFYKEL